MPDYAEMYRVLFRSMTKAIDILQQAQLQTEEMFISGGEATITVLPPTNGNETEDGDQT